LKTTNNNIDESIKLLFERNGAKKNQEDQKIQCDKLNGFKEIKELIHEEQFKEILLHVLKTIFDERENSIISSSEENGLIF
jgi:hypothetical protein